MRVWDGVFGAFFWVCWLQTAADLVFRITSLALPHSLSAGTTNGGFGPKIGGF